MAGQALFVVERAENSVESPRYRIRSINTKKVCYGCSGTFYPFNLKCDNFGQEALENHSQLDVLVNLNLGAVSSAGEHRPYKPGVTGSNPVPPTRKVRVPNFDVQVKNKNPKREA